MDCLYNFEGEFDSMSKFAEDFLNHVPQYFVVLVVFFKSGHVRQYGLPCRKTKINSSGRKAMDCLRAGAENRYGENCQKIRVVPGQWKRGCLFINNP
jgi:hypothetical protein